MAYTRSVKETAACREESRNKAIKQYASRFKFFQGEG